MTVLALGLLLVAAVMHATWNLLSKRAGGGAGFVWLFSAIGAAIYAPIVAVVVLVQRPHLTAAVPIFICGSALLHMTYFVLLQRGYRAGDLSVVYPLARGTGPLLATGAAILWFGERPAPVAVAGAVCIALGAVLLTSGPHVSHGARAAVVYGLLTGATIAAYTLWDKQAVAVAMVPPLLQDWGSQAGLAMLLLPYALGHRDDVRAHWRDHRVETVGIAILAPLAYLLVLAALVFTPVSYVAPARETSILIGTLMGTRLLAEGQGPRRLVAAGAMLLGIVALVA